MARGNILDDLRELDLEILNEVIREGEMRVQAQFEAANAADQRGMAWCALLVTVAVAAIGGGGALLLSDQHLVLSAIAIGFCIAIGCALKLAIDSVRPGDFHFPGNLPENWLPAQWEADRPRDIVQAKIEQARCLNNLIADNIEWADRAGGKLRRSMDVTWRSIVLSALFSLGSVGLEAWPKISANVMPIPNSLLLHRPAIDPKYK